MSGWSLAASPLLPWWAIAAFAVAALILIAFGAGRRARGLALRLLAVMALAAIAVNPSLVEEQRAPQHDVAAVIVDESQSMSIGQRRQYADAALKAVTDQLARLPNLDVRVVHAGAPDAASPLADDGTRLYTALSRAFADVPRQRIAGAILITDGEIHDMPPPARLASDAPLHVLLTGRPGEADRRLVVGNAPRFGLVGKTVQLSVRVEDLPTGKAQGEAQLTIRKDGGLPVIRAVPVGEDVTVPVAIDHGGPNVVELAVDAGPHELTLENNRAAFVINGVRDRLKVLLVSGEPNQDERTWRNILKSDPSVDLIHFTILRPPEKQDGTPIRELSLIAFPIRELFDVKLHQFDLIIFDRYRQRSVLPQAYLENIANYVRDGGALLVSAGPSFATPLSLYRTPLGAVLPAEPTGTVFEQGFVPRVTAIGRRDPVTEDLPGLPEQPSAVAPWGRWFRDIGAQAQRGVTVMTGYQDQPLLVLDRVGKGRVAQFLSDEMWLWTRGYEGGGPQAELLRRVVYWLMKEPDLAENDLRAKIDGNQLTVTRQSLEPDDSPVQVTLPDGRIAMLTLAPQHGGRSGATMAVSESGLYRASDGQRTALAAAGSLNPIEMSDVRTTDQKVTADVAATGGGIFWVGPGRVPDIREIEPGRSAAGHDWIGLRRNGDYVVTGVGETPLLPGALALILALGLLILAWRREGR
ncbi:MAG: hypothetical protein KGL11_13940 [Alphaproteobacteria bacterium]|nr:hypothetical protein [Alphaproteobacteria bacterium]